RSPKPGSSATTTGSTSSTSATTGTAPCSTPGGTPRSSSPTPPKTSPSCASRAPLSPLPERLCPRDQNDRTLVSVPGSLGEHGLGLGLREQREEPVHMVRGPTARPSEGRRHLLSSPLAR